jgi:prepilin-type N-terminal cleavage/methylation domain-containing protein
MRTRRFLRCRKQSQAGFSMVEMLMAAFILAVGILGLTMLQTLSIKTASGSRGLSTAVLLAERVLDQIEADGRNSRLYAQNAMVPTTTAEFTAPIPARTFNYFGRPAVGDPIDTTPYFNVNVAAVTAAAGGTPGVIAPPVANPRFGGVAVMTVTVAWNEDPAAPARQVVLSRRVAYATAI